MGSGLIYAMVILVWVAYLVPSWVHREDLGARSVQRYKRAMRLVSRGTEAPIVLTDEERRHSRALMRRRRMVVLISLGMTLLLSTFFAAVGVFAAWFPAIPLLASAIYITHVRRAVVAEQIAASRASAARRMQGQVQQPRSVDPTEVRRSAPKPSTVIAPSAPVRPSTTVRVHTTGEAKGPWSPVDVPLPTYVTAPKAVRAHRVIDLTRPGEWTEAQKQAEEARLRAVAPSSDEVFDQVAAEEAVALAEQLAAKERRASGNP